MVSVCPEGVQINFYTRRFLDVTIPIGNPIDCGKTIGKDVHEVNLWTKGGMGLGKQQGVHFDFQIKGVEKTNQFFQDLIKQTGASFPLFASHTLSVYDNLQKKR